MLKLGETLRERRQALGRTLEQAEAATRIRARLLKALEEGEYDRLPAPGYVRGYITSYARFLELEPKPLLEQFDAEIGHPGSERLRLPQTREAVVPRHEQHALPKGAVIAGVLVAGAILLGVWVVGRPAREPAPTLPEPAVPSAPSTPAAEPGAGRDGATSRPDRRADLETTAPEPESEPAAQALPFTLEVKVAERGASWLRIIVDGLKAYEGTLTGGQSKTFVVATSASVRIGRPSDVVVLKDGRPVPIPDADTPTLTLTATPEQ